MTAAADEYDNLPNGPAWCPRDESGNCRPATWEEKLQDNIYHHINQMRADFCRNYADTFGAQRWCIERGYAVPPPPKPEPSVFASRHDQVEALRACEKVPVKFKNEVDAKARQLTGLPAKKLLSGYAETAIRIVNADWRPSHASRKEDTILSKIYEAFTDVDSISKYQSPILECYVANMNAIGTPACATQEKLTESVNLALASQENFAHNFGVAIDLIIDELVGGEIPGGKTASASYRCAEALRSLK